MLVLALILSLWLVRPFGLIADYVRYVRAQRSFSLPRLGRRARSARWARPTTDARRAGQPPLRGRLCAETPQHELKSPLGVMARPSSMQESGMPEADRQRFVANIGREDAAHPGELVDRMMELAALEQQRRLPKVEPVSLRPLLEELAASAEAAAAPRAACASISPRARRPGSRARRSCCAAPWATCWPTRSSSPDGGTVHLALTVRRRSVS